MGQALDTQWCTTLTKSSPLSRYERVMINKLVNKWLTLNEKNRQK